MGAAAVLSGLRKNSAGMTPRSVRIVMNPKVRSNEVLSASDALRREADVLRAEIDAFLSNIRAA